MSSAFKTSNQQLPCDVLFSRLSPNRSRQLVGYGGRDCAVHVFPFAKHSPVARLEGLTSPVTALAFSYDQTSVVAGSETGGLLSWDLATEQSLRVAFKGHYSTITDVTMHITGTHFAAVSTDGNLRVWDKRCKSCVQSYRDCEVPLCAVQLSPNDRWIVSGCANGIVRIYDKRTAKVEGKFQMHTGVITSLSFHPNTYHLAAGSGDGTCSVWSLETFRKEFRSGSIHKPIDSVQLHGDHLYIASDKLLRVYTSPHFSDDTALSIPAPWTTVSDMAYVSFSDEVWFVQCSGSTATTGRLSLGDGLARVPPSPPAEGAPRPEVAPRPQAAPPNAPPQRKSVPSRRVGVAAATAPPQRSAAIPPTLPRSQWLAGQESNVVEKPHVPSETLPAPEQAAGSGVPQTQACGPAPALPELPPFDEGGSELSVLEQLTSTSATFTALMHRRLTHLQEIRSLWAQDQRGAILRLRRACEDGSEAGCVYDFLTAMQQQRMKERMQRDALPHLLDVIQCSLNSSYDPLLLVALRTLRSMNTKFRARMEEGQRRARLMQSNGYNDPLGVNSAADCAQRFSACGVHVMALASRRDAIGDEARHLAAELSP